MSERQAEVRLAAMAGRICSGCSKRSSAWRSTARSMTTTRVCRIRDAINEYDGLFDDKS